MKKVGKSMKFNTLRSFRKLPTRLIINGYQTSDMLRMLLICIRIQQRNRIQNPYSNTFG